MYAGRNPVWQENNMEGQFIYERSFTYFETPNLTGCVAAVLLILFDQFSKMLTVAHLKDQPSTCSYTVWFLCALFCGHRFFYFGMMQNKLMILIPVTVVVTLFILYLFQKLPATRHFFLAQMRLPYCFCGSHREFHRPRQTGAMW